MNSLDLNSYNYNLPEELIALKPAQPRDSARLLVFDIAQNKIEHHQVKDLPQFLPKNSVLVLNESKVLPARLTGHRLSKNKKTGAYLEVLLIQQKKTTNFWQCKLFNSRKVKLGEIFELCDGKIQAQLEKKNEDGSCDLQFFFEGNFFELLQKHGLPPLPPYIRKKRPENFTGLDDKTSYQTVFAKNYGSIAAPTAGLHFSDKLLKKIATKIPIEKITLHVGLGTFEPLQNSNIAENKLHTEFYNLKKETLQEIKQALAEQKKIVAVGTTTVRCLENIFSIQQISQQTTQSLSGQTDIFIYPPYEFQVTSAMLTNFHLPQSSLMLLVAAFCGIENLHHLYREAIKEKYRFYSYGDCMLLHKFS